MVLYAHILKQTVSNVRQYVFVCVSIFFLFLSEWIRNFVACGDDFLLCAVAVRDVASLFTCACGNNSICMRSTHTFHIVYHCVNLGVDDDASNMHAWATEVCAAPHVCSATHINATCSAHGHGKDDPNSWVLLSGKSAQQRSSRHQVVAPDGK